MRCGREDRILRFQHSDIGVAVALDGGLITPVIRNAEAKSLTAISAEMRDLAERARAKKLKPNEYQGGVERHLQSRHVWRARILPPSSIRRTPPSSRSAPRAARRSRREDGGVKFVSQMTVTLSCDHRVVDGALGAAAAGGVQDA